MACLAACEEQDARTSEIWVIDFDTYGGEVEETLAELAIDRTSVEEAVLVHLQLMFGTLPVTFEIGSEIGSATKSSICVRHGSEMRIGRGLLNFGNTRPVHDCGEPDGTEHGAFINRIATIFVSQDTPRIRIAERADAFAKLLALVLAHEIAHGLGIEHSTADFGRGDIMKAAPIFDVDEIYYFNAEHQVQLASLIVGG